MSRTIPPVRACVFDAYGTLFDVHSAAASCRDALGADFERFSVLWRDKQMQYTWLRAAQNRHADFWQVTGEALDFALETFGIAEPALRERLMALYLELKPFADARDALIRLRAASRKTAILSNGSPTMLEAIVSNSGFAGLFDAILSVEDVGVFKPHPKVYGLACARLDLPPNDILFISSNGWDAYAASAFGMRVAWCNRYDQRPEGLPGHPDAVVKTLAEIPPLLGA